MGEPRTLIISDTHLGRRSRTHMTAEALRPLWQGFDRVVFNGDIAEVQMPHLRAQSAREVQRVIEYTERDGVELTVISGNHDAYISDIRHLTLMDGQVLITHGDVLHPAIAPWTHTAARMKATTDAAIAASLPEEEADIRYRLILAQYVSHSEFLHSHNVDRNDESGLKDLLCRPWRFGLILKYWAQVPGLAAQFAQQCCPDAQVIVFGHSHHQGIWQRRGKTVINTGSFDFPGRPRGVVIQGNTLAVHDITRHHNAYALATRPRYQKTLPTRDSCADPPINRAA